jgi:hypothetical protein
MGVRHLTGLRLAVPLWKEKVQMAIGRVVGPSFIMLATDKTTQTFYFAGRYCLLLALIGM